MIRSELVQLIELLDKIEHWAEFDRFDRSRIEAAKDAALMLLDWFDSK